MKTEQAIKKLGQTLWEILGREYIDKYCEDKNGNLVSVSSISVDEIAEELVNAGYGDVSEYKDEIESLQAHLDLVKAEIKVRRIPEQSVYECVFNNENPLVKEKVKQAKIDVLAELNAKYGMYLCYSWHCDTKSLSEIIDELIKEVQNGKDKG